MARTVTIDGSYGEGGGQVLRTSLALSALTGKELEIFNVRAGRARLGLRPQHLQAVKAATAICRAEVSGADIGSQTIRFVPGRVRAGDYRFDIGTAGSTSLVLHTVYLPLALSAGGSSRVTITGGTHVPLSPCFHYLDLSWRWHLAHVGIALMLTMERAGFYPPGGGIIHAAIESASRARSLCLDQRGALLRVRGISAARLPAHVAERQRWKRRIRFPAHTSGPFEVIDAGTATTGQTASISS